MQNVNLLDFYTRFLLNIKKLNLKTVEDYKQNISLLIKWSEKPADKITIQDIYGYIEYLNNQNAGKTSRYYHLNNSSKYSLGTIKNKIIQIRKFFERLNDMGYTSIKSRLIVPPRAPKTTIKSIPHYIILQLLQAPSEHQKRDDVMLRDTIFFQLGYYCGLRINEALNVKFTDFNKDYLIVLGKGKKKRTVPIPFIIKENVLKYKKIRGGIIKYKQHYKTKKGVEKTRTYTVEDKNPNLVITCLDNVKYGSPVDPKGFCKLFRTYEKFLEIDYRITYHQLRHTFATRLIQCGVGLETVQEMMGHSNISSTERYVHVSDTQKKKAQLQIIRCNFEQNL